MKPDLIKSHLMNETEKGDLVVAPYGRDTIKGIVVDREGEYVLVVKLSNEDGYQLSVVKVRDGDACLNLGKNWRFDVQLHDLSNVHFNDTRSVGNILITDKGLFVNVIHGSTHSKHVHNLNIQDWNFENYTGFVSASVSSWSLFLLDEENKNEKQVPFFSLK